MLNCPSIQQEDTAIKLSFRFVVPLLIVLGTLAYLTVPLVDQLTLTWFKRDLALRGELVSKSVVLGLTDLPLRSSKIIGILEEYAKDERLLAIGHCDSNNKLIHKTLHFPASIKCGANDSDSIVPLENGPVHIYRRKIGTDSQDEIILLHDLSFVQRRSEHTKKLILLFFLALTIIVSSLTVLVAKLSFKGWTNSIRALITGQNIFNSKAESEYELNPIASDLRVLVKELERERKIRDEANISWTPRVLKELLQKELSGDEILILSNREPYIHNKIDGNIVVQVPASGLVTALEPIMRACSGTWIAHGSGSADREVVDEYDHVQVPPLNPTYRIRRVWLTPEEEAGYYYGFSNEGLWPLCHIAHTRPTFRTDDWKMYKKVNEKFAEAVIAESKTDNPVILIQDYHFALAPMLIRKKLPKATIITFWHIPWPNSESFGICPWHEEILEGLLGSSILGFHTRLHCNNFLDSIDRFLECRIDRDLSQVSFNKHISAVRAYPISIEWPPQSMGPVPDVAICRQNIRIRNKIHKTTMIGIGVDRFDYTKGILERFLAIEHLLELYPEYIGKFTFIQIAAPTRSSIKQYQHFQSDVQALTEKINLRFGSGDYRPILLLAEHHDPARVFEYFRAADCCFVSSLHDGMNLVAKEFLAARTDDEGVLILSQFTGASKELPEALIVNPYDIGQCAHALAQALRMPLSEQKERMRNMRAHVSENNIYRWAGKMLIDAARMRQRNRITRQYGAQV